MEESAQTSYQLFLAGTPDDPRRGIGRCLTCETVIVKYQHPTGLWVDVSGKSHSGHQVEPEPEPHAISQNVNGKEELIKTLFDLQLEMSREDLESYLGLTVNRDNANKTITFLDMLLAQTDEDQFNIGFQAESSTGKSYIPIELLEYFPDGEKRTYAGASPTSFYHEMGIYKPLTEAAQELDLSALFDENELTDPKRRVIVVDLRSKILVFLDQPHWQLLEKLRPLLSHDRRMLRYSITDKMGKGSLRAKTVIILGFSSVIFCTTKPTQEDQERTRLNLLSPESSQEKIRESLSLQAEKIGNRKAFREKLESDPERKWLKNRVQMIRTTRIRDIIIPDVESILERFKATRPHLAPRHQRDFPRLLFYVKGFALLNCFQRERVDDETIRANYIDIESGFKVYLEIAKSNELGISPETYRIYEEVLLPLAKLNPDVGLPRIDVVKAYLQRYGRPLPWKRLTTDILPALESAGLIRQDKNPDDRRETLVWCPIPGNIVESGNKTPHNTAPPSNLVTSDHFSNHLSQRELLTN